MILSPFALNLQTPWSRKAGEEAQNKPREGPLY